MLINLKTLAMRFLSRKQLISDDALSELDKAQVMAGSHAGDAVSMGDSPQGPV